MGVEDYFKGIGIGALSAGIILSNPAYSQTLDQKTKSYEQIVTEQKNVVKLSLDELIKEIGNKDILLFGEIHSNMSAKKFADLFLSKLKEIGYENLFLEGLPANEVKGLKYISEKELRFFDYFKIIDKDLTPGYFWALKYNEKNREGIKYLIDSAFKEGFKIRGAGDPLNLPYKKGIRHYKDRELKKEELDFIVGCLMMETRNEIHKKFPFIDIESESFEDIVRTTLFKDSIMETLLRTKLENPGKKIVFYGGGSHNDPQDLLNFGVVKELSEKFGRDNICSIDLIEIGTLVEVFMEAPQFYLEYIYLLKECSIDDSLGVLKLNGPKVDYIVFALSKDDNAN